MQAAREIYPEIALNWPRPDTKVFQGERSRFEFNKFLFVVLVFGVAAFVHVYQQALVAQNGIEIARLKSAIKEDTSVNQNLKIERMILKSPSRLERLATVKLGMVRPTKVTYIKIPSTGLAARSAPTLQPKTGQGAMIAGATVMVR